MIEQAAKLIKEANRVIAFSGAGISVESGIPSFRGPEGLWSKYDPIVLDLGYFYDNPKKSWLLIKEIFYDYFSLAKPNSAHLALTQLEKKGFIGAIITQNIDSLHQAAKSKNVIEFHGSSSRLVCTGCNRVFDFKPEMLQKLPPICPNCGGLLKPDFVFFGEGIATKAFQESLNETKNADLWLVIGTSGEIMPASSLVYEARQNGATIVEVNLRPSNYTADAADFFLQGKAGDLLPKIADLVLEN